MQASEIIINAYTVKDFCRAYGVGRTLAYAEMAAGRLRARKAGRRTLILKADADGWLNALPAGRSRAQKAIADSAAESMDEVHRD